MCSLHFCLSLLSMYPTHNGQGLFPFNQNTMLRPLSNKESRSSTAVFSDDSVFSCPVIHQQVCLPFIQYGFWPTQMTRHLRWLVIWSCSFIENRDCWCLFFSLSSPYLGCKPYIGCQESVTFIVILEPFSNVLSRCGMGVGLNWNQRQRVTMDCWWCWSHLLLIAKEVMWNTTTRLKLDSD